MSIEKVHKLAIVIHAEVVYFLSLDYTKTSENLEDAWVNNKIKMSEGESETTALIGREMLWVT
jgi:hypothetical protein